MPKKEVSLAETTSSLSSSSSSSSSSTSHTQRRGLLIRDCIIGFADGLTVPFALTAGLSALGDAHLVVMGGVAELLAGALSMGLGAYLAAITERKRYQVEERRERRDLRDSPNLESVVEVLERYGVSDGVAGEVAQSLKDNEDMWVKFKMNIELKLEMPDRKMAWIEGCIMGTSYFMGGLLPMIPYFAGFREVNDALFTSIGITVVILIAFGYVKAISTGTTRVEALWCAVQTLWVGASAAGVSYGIVYSLNKAIQKDEIESVLNQRISLMVPIAVSILRLSDEVPDSLFWHDSRILIIW